MNKQELLLKIKALSEQGEGGEKINAKRILARLMKKFNISEEDLQEEKVEEFDLVAKGQYERKLLNQVVYSVCGNIDERKGLWSYTKIKNKFCVKSTKAEFLEIEARFNFYKNCFYKKLDVFYLAFIQTNDIYPPNNLMKESKTKRFFLSDEEKEALELSAVMEKSNYLKQIENKNKEEL